MCSILGGNRFDGKAYDIYDRAKDRGRDFSGMAQLGSFWVACHRATPTTEEETPLDNQPVGRGVKFVHNGTIENDGMLGAVEGELDSAVLPRVLNTNSLEEFRDSLSRIKGSYAIAALKDGAIYLACNYKPIFILRSGTGVYFSSQAHHLGKGALRMPPYSVCDLITGESLKIPRRQADSALVICSGGLDSTAVAAYARRMHKSTRLLHFAYGCRAEAKEQEAIGKIALALGCGVSIVPMPYVGMEGGSPLLTDGEIASGKAGAEYACEWVPARNFLFLAYATAYAEANGYGHIYLGINLEEGGAYPDNEHQFIKDVDACLYGAVQNGVKIQIHAPLGNLMKREIVDFGFQYGAPLELSWSCYKDGAEHCGQCAPCFMRRTAYNRAGRIDPTKYLTEQQNPLKTP